MRRQLALGALAAALLALPALPLGQYPFHLIVLMLLWAFIDTAWSMMGRFGLVSLGHGAFLGVAMYTTAMLWNTFHLTPWLGMAAGLVGVGVLAVLIGYPSFRFQVLGHYFALVTLALGEVVRLGVIAARDWTGGSLGMTPQRVPGTQVDWSAFQFSDKRYFYYLALALWAAGLVISRAINKSRFRSALIAISEDEVAAASLGIHVTSAKLRVTVLSALLTAVGGVMLCQYNMFISPESVSIDVSLQIVFASIVGGMYSLAGPTVGAVLTLGLDETLRNTFGTRMIGASATIYGALLVAFIIFMPNGIVGRLESWWANRGRGVPPASGRTAPAGASAATRDS